MLALQSGHLRSAQCMRFDVLHSSVQAMPVKFLRFSWELSAKVCPASHTCHLVFTAGIMSVYMWVACCYRCRLHGEIAFDCSPQLISRFCLQWLPQVSRIDPTFFEQKGLTAGD
jgi:hypothetical protein